jgi:hypothetical protein
MRPGVLVLLIVAAAPGHAAAEPEPPSDPGVFAEVGYVAEWSHWATPSGHGGVFVSGVTYTESRGPFVNIMLSGIAGSGSNYECVRRTSRGCESAIDTGPSEQERAAAAAILSRRPFALTLTGFHESLGSEIDGVDARLGLVRPERGAVMMIGVAGGITRSNRRDLMPPDPGVPDPPDQTFSRDWLGGYVEGRGGGLRMRLVIAYSTPFLVLGEVGYERQLGRFNLGASLITDSYKPGRAGVRAGIGVVF